MWKCKRNVVKAPIGEDGGFVYLPSASFDSNSGQVQVTNPFKEYGKLLDWAK